METGISMTSRRTPEDPHPHGKEAALKDLTLALDRARSRRRLPPPAERHRLRVRVGVSLAVIARAIGVTTATVSRWETGDREPTNVHLKSYAAVLARLARELANDRGKEQVARSARRGANGFHRARRRR